MSLRDRFPFSAIYRFIGGSILPRVQPHFKDPDSLTWLGAGLALGVPLAFWLHPLWGAGLIILSGLADVLDGMLARNRCQETAFGAFLDSSVDRVSDFAYLLGFGVLGIGRPMVGLGAALILIAILGTFQISYLRARAQSLSVACDIGWMERGQRTLYLILWALLLAVWPAGRIPIWWGGLCLYTGLVWWTVVQRFRHVRKIMTGSQQVD